jgi:UDP-N-acetylmuramoyl-tripeptide--D-alanyl-D-alanine ligase
MGRLLLQKILRFMARTVLMKYKPKIIGITGSVGKSSTKEAIALVLEPHFRIRKNEGNYNNEIGLPLTILGTKSGGRSLVAWMKIFLTWCGLMFLPKQYPEILILEMGIDRKGDMDYLLSIVSLHIGVATHVSGSHMKHFGTLQGIYKEKRKLIKAVPKEGFAIVNADNEWTKRMADITQAKVLTYGFGDKADIRVDNLLFHGDTKNVEGFSFKLNYKGKSVPMRLPALLAKHLIPSVLAAVGVGVAFKLNLVEIARSLEGFKSLPGRMHMFLGRNDSFLIDDTYNASPTSMRAAIETLAHIQAPRKGVILGDMLELGDKSDEEHVAMLTDLKQANVSFAILVGEHMAKLKDALIEAGFSSKYLHTALDPMTASKYAQEIIRAGDVVLIKGSQGLRMEIVVEGLLAQPELASTLLCRQSEVWKNIPFTAPEEWSEKN